MTHDRDGLIEGLLQAGAGLIAFVAPAGFGKTTIARRFAARCGGPAIEVDLHGCPDVVGLARTLIDALAEASPGAAPALASSEIATAAVPGRDWLGVVASLWRASPRDAVVVLDGLEALRNEPDAVALLTTLLRQRDSRTIVLCSRPPLPIALGKLAAPNDYVVAGPEELRLTDAETDAILAAGGASEAQRIVSVELTQGWPFAVYLLRRFAQTGTLGTFLARGARQGAELQDYLLSEVLDALDEAQLEMLRAIATLPRPTAAILNVVLGVADVDADIAELRAALPLVTRGADGYALHPLLRAAIRFGNRARFGAMLAAAAEKLEASGSYLDAAETYKASGDAAGTVRCLERLVKLAVESPPTRFAHVAADLDFPVVSSSPLVWAAMVRARRLCVDPQKLVEEGAVVWDVARRQGRDVESIIAGVFALLLADAGEYERARVLLDDTEAALEISTDRPSPADATILTARAFVEATQDRYAVAGRYYRAALGLIHDPHIRAGIMMHTRLREACAQGEFERAVGLFDVIDEYAGSSGMPITLSEALIEGIFVAWVSGEATLEERLKRLRTQSEYCAAPDITALAQGVSEVDLTAVAAIRNPRYRAYGALMCAGLASDAAAARAASELASQAAINACDAFVGVLAGVTAAIVDPHHRARHLDAAKTLTARIESEPLATDVELMRHGSAPKTVLAGFVARLEARFPEARLEFDAAAGRLWFGETELELSTNARGMLLLLGNAPGHEVAGEELQDALWPDSDAEASRARLKMLVHRIRTQAQRDVIVARRSGYALNCVVRLSPASIEEQLSGTLADDTSEAAIATLERLADALETTWPNRLLELERFALLAGRLSDLRAQAFSLLIDRLSAAGRFERAYLAAQRFAKSNPYDEHAREAAIRLAVRTGRKALARRAYASYRKMMESEYGSTPPRTLDEIVSSELEK